MAMMVAMTKMTVVATTMMTKTMMMIIMMVMAAAAGCLAAMVGTSRVVSRGGRGEATDRSVVVVVMVSDQGQRRVSGLANGGWGLKAGRVGVSEVSYALWLVGLLNVVWKLQFNIHSIVPSFACK